MLRLLAFAVALLVTAQAAPARADESQADESKQDSPLVEEVMLGVYAQGWGNIGADKEQGVGLSLEAAFRSPVFLGVVGAPRPHIGFIVGSDSDATNQIYAGLEWRQYLKKRFFASLSLGGAVHDGATEYRNVIDRPRRTNTVFLGCPVLFRVAGDIGYDVSNRVRASIHMAHISNANLCTPNEGLDHFGARIGYRF